MPRYDYTCSHCGTAFEAYRPVAERLYAACPACPHEAERVFTPTRYLVVPAHFKLMISDTLPDPDDKAGWENRGTGNNSQVTRPRTPSLREAFDKVKDWG